MFQRVLSVLLSASLLAGSVTSTAYAAPGDTGYAAAIEAEADESQEPQETSEADLYETPETEESTDDSQTADTADEDSDVADEGGGIANPEDTTDPSDKDEVAEVVAEEPYAVAALAGEGEEDEEDDEDVENLSLDVSTPYELERGTHWFKFTAPEDEKYEFCFDIQNEAVYNPDYIGLYQTQTTNSDDAIAEFSTGDTTKHWLKRSAMTIGQEMYIKVTVNNSDAMQLTIKIAKMLTPEESATDLQLNDVSSISLEDNQYENEAKWLKFTAPEEGDYRFGFYAGDYPTTINLKFYKGSPDGDPIDDVVHLWSLDSCSKEISLEKDQLVYIQAWPQDDGERPTFNVQVTKKNDIVEDPAASAQELTLDVVSSIFLDANCSMRNAKWLKFTASEEGSYQFRFETTSVSDIYVDLYKDATDGEMIDSQNVYDYNTPWSTVVRLQENQEVYIKAYPDSVTSGQSFNVTVSKYVISEDSAQELVLGRLTTVSLDANRTQDEAKWLKVTASEAGDYLFWFNTKNSSDIYVYMYQDSTDGSQIGYKNVYGSDGENNNPWSKTINLEANQQVYIKAYPYTNGASGQNFDVKVSKAVEVTDRTQNEDGSCQAVVNGRTIKVTPDVSYRSFSATVSVSSQTSTTVNYVVKDEDGYNIDYENGITASNGVATIKIPNLEMGKKYFLELSLLIDRNERVVFASSTNPIEFTTLSMEKDGDDREVKVSVTPRLNRADLKVTVTGKAAEYNDNYVWFFYKKADDATDIEWKSTRFDVYGLGTEEFTLGDLEKETKYTYVIGLSNDSSGVTPDNDKLKEPTEDSFTTLADDRTITRLDITPSLNYADIEIILGGKAAANNDNLLLLYYREKDAEQWERQTLDFYGTKDETRISRYNDVSLKEDTTYEYVIGFAENSETSKDDLTASKSGEFSTIKDDREVSVTVDTYLDRAELNFVVSGNAAKKRDNYISLYYREKKSETEQESEEGWNSVSSSKYGVGTYTSFIRNLNGEALKQGTTYEYEYGFGDSYYTERENLIGGNKGTFTIPTDDRKVTVSASDITTKPTSASIRAAVSGKTAEGMTNYVLLYYKDSESESEDDWTRRSTTVSGSGIAPFSITYLESGKTYDYVIGIGDSSTTSREELTGTADGNFTTTADTTELADVKVSAGYERATIQAFVTGNNTGSTKYVYFFYRPKNGESENPWISAGSSLEASPSYTITGLTQGVSYEYAVVAGNYGITSDDIEDAKIKKTSEFTTKKSAYTLDIKADESLTTHNSAVLKVAAAGGQDEKVNVNFDVYKVVDDGQEYVNTYAIDLKQGSNYQGTKKLSGLEPETTYVLASAWVSVSDEGYATIIDTIDLSNVTFKTTEVIEPKSITLIPDKVTLTVPNGSLVEGISRKSLKWVVEPTNAVLDILWSSDDYNVAYVVSSGADVYVRAVNPGTTKIRATSLYGEVYGEMEVTVKDYVVKTANGEPITGTNVLSKGKTLGSAEDKLGLYERNEAGTYTTVDIADVEVYRSNVAAWDKENCVLTANAVGTTDIVFTAADGGKAVIKLQVTAAAESKGFGITGLTSSNSNYPAKEDNGSYMVANGYRYTAVGEISPTEPFEASDFTWTSSDESVATVANGVITTVKAGSVTIIVKPDLAEGEESPYKQDEVEIKLTVRDLPSVSTPTVYALTNLDGKKGKMSLKDVDIVKELGKGWSWVYPDTPLYSLPTNSNYYAFEAVYSGEEYYACETKVNVYIGTVTGVRAYEPDEYYDYDTDIDYSFAWHNQVLAVSDNDTTDTLCLGTSIGYNGNISSDVVVSIPSQDGLTIEEKTGSWYKDDEGEVDGKIFLIKATKAGTYDLKPQVVRVTKDASGNAKPEVITQTSYKIKVVENPQVGSIEFTTTDKDITVDGNSIYLDYTTSMRNKTFNLTAIARDREGNRIDTALQWKVTDKAVATVKADRDTHSATVTVKGDGHAILFVTAKDAAGYTEEFPLEFRDHKPRVSTNKASINLAYDYDDEGRYLAYSKLGAIEIASVYNESIQSVKLYDKDGTTPVTNMSVSYFVGSDTAEYIVVPVNPDSLSTGTYPYKLAVKTSASKAPYLYDLKVTVIDKAPKVTAKMQDTINLFYLNKTGSIKLSVSGDYNDFGQVTWKQQSTGVNNGFSVNQYPYYDTKSKGYIATVSQQQIQMNGKNLADPDIAVGTLTVKLDGIRKPIVISNFKMKWNYKKPTLKTEKSTTNIVPETGSMKNRFIIRDTLAKKPLYTNDYSFNVSSGQEDVAVLKSGTIYDSAYKATGTGILYTYSGNSSKVNLTLNVDSDYWREPLTAKHTIKSIKPKAYLSSTQLTYNQAYKSASSISIGVKDAYVGVTLRDVAIEGSNAKAKKLVEDDIFEISGSGSSITVKLNKAALMEVTPPKGTYTFKLTPYYTAQDGSKVAMNKLNLKLKVEDKAPTVTVSTKGKLDLAKSTVTDIDQNSICLKANIKNIGSNYTVEKVEILGEYSDYFNVRKIGSSKLPTNPYYLKIRGGSYGKLKAGQAYKFNVKYTVRTTGNDEFTVTTTKQITVKPVQTAPKITVRNNGQTFYAGATITDRTYYISVPEGYSISNEYGSIMGRLDCNKDGEPDIIVSMYSNYNTAAYLTVSIVDKDAVTASAKGKTYSIPITVRVTGRDGIAKDAKATIKVKVKR